MKRSGRAHARNHRPTPTTSGSSLYAPASFDASTKLFTNEAIVGSSGASRRYSRARRNPRRDGADRMHQAHVDLAPAPFFEPKRTFCLGMSPCQIRICEREGALRYRVVETWDELAVTYEAGGLRRRDDKVSQQTSWLDRRKIGRPDRFVRRQQAIEDSISTSRRRGDVLGPPVEYSIRMRGTSMYVPRQGPPSGLPASSATSILGPSGWQGLAVPCRTAAREFPHASASP